jgi:hypothetical protein
MGSVEMAFSRLPTAVPSPTTERTNGDINYSKLKSERMDAMAEIKARV